MTALRFAFFISFLLVGAGANASLCAHSIQFCGYVTGNRSSSSPAYPSRSSSINMNPSAVPVEKGFGAEAIVFKNQWDLSLVKGLGRVGAAISPANNEETFFGPPGFELPEDLLERKQNQEKYPSQKFTLATAFNVFSNKQTGLHRLELNLGVVAKYNRVTTNVRGGGGISGVAGPFTFGYSIYGDENVLDYARYGLDRKDHILYNVETYSLGIFLSSFAFDYSILRLVTTDVATVSVATLSLMLKQGIFTVAQRHELSSRPAYNYATAELEPREKKDELFLGAQFSATSWLMLGAFYNYYALRELSLGTTIFF